MKVPPAYAVLALAGGAVVATGALSGSDAREVALTRGAPVLGFLVALTVLSALADRAGVLDAAARGCARLAGGSTPRLFLLVAALATVTTIGMSLDTTAVLLTPVVLSLTRQLGLRPLPFAMLAVWLANTASLLLPVSNLTNLLALQRTHDSTVHFAGRMALPALVAVVVTVAYLGVVYRRDLRGRFELPPTPKPHDPVAFWVSATACIALAPGVLAGAPPWAVATPCALAALAAQPRQFSWSLLPWRVVLLTEGLFLVVTAIAHHGLTRLLADLAGSSGLAATGTAAVASNALNNLPAYLAIEPAVPAGNLFFVLLGTNAGPLVLLWGSLATILWRERCRDRGLAVSVRHFALVGLGGVPLVLLGSWAALLA